MTNDYVQATEISTLIQGFELNDTPGMGALTTTQADALIQVIEGEVNGMVASLGFQTPVTSGASPKTYKFLRAIVVQGAMALIQGSLHALTDDTEGSREQAFWRRYEQALKRMHDNGGSSLIDAVAVVGDASGNVPPSIGVQSENVDRYLPLRELTVVRQYDNEWAASRLARSRGRTRYFEGGINPGFGPF